MSEGQGRVTNPETDNRVKYNLEPEKLQSAINEADVDKGTDLHPNSKSGAAADVADKLGVDSEDRNARRAIDRAAKREGLTDRD